MDSVFGVLQDHVSENEIVLAGLRKFKDTSACVLIIQRGLFSRIAGDGNRHARLTAVRERDSLITRANDVTSIVKPLSDEKHITCRHCLRAMINRAPRLNEVIFSSCITITAGNRK